MAVDPDVLLDPLRNKGTAFSEEERTALGLHGILPVAVESVEQQVSRAYASFQEYETALEKHIYLREVQDTNEVLFHRLIADHVAEMLPIIYTPTVALACQVFSRIYRRPRGLFLSYSARDRMREALRNRFQEAVDVIVVTDGERVLGIGDQGIGGMGIPIGKLSLYTAIGGIDPARTLPITLDVGTNDEARLANPGYLGWRHHRVTGANYDAFIDEFVEAVRAELPDALLQWEDFSLDHARPILDRYRDSLLTFNDDIQGTAAVTLATVLAACEVSSTSLTEHRFAFLGAGSAATGVAEYLATALVAMGLPLQEAYARFALVDVSGLLTDDRTDLNAAQRPFATPVGTAALWAKEGRPGLAEVVAGFRPTVLIGLSTAGGAFTEPIVRDMAAQVRRPVILPLSNPSSRAEALPADLLAWTDGRALVATGSPFPPVSTPNGSTLISQCNNAFIFPAMGLAAVAANATRVTDTMFLAAARALAALSPARTSPEAGLLPAVTELSEIAPGIALAVAVQAVTEGVAAQWSASELEERIRNLRWVPDYPEAGG
jgi:malate dehydrogenase (oxaloacetate-decarboxylating)